MTELSYIGKLICAALIAIGFGLLVTTALAPVLPSTSPSQFGVSTIYTLVFLGAAAIGGYVGYKIADLMASTALYSIGAEAIISFLSLIFIWK